MIYINNNRAINFRHSNIDNPENIYETKKRLNSQTYILKTRVVECEIFQVEGTKIVEVIAYGKSMCHPKDNFNKEFGGKNVLSRALAYLPKEERTCAWNAYFSR